MGKVFQIVFAIALLCGKVLAAEPSMWSSHGPEGSDYFIYLGATEVVKTDRVTAAINGQAVLTGYPSNVTNVSTDSNLVASELTSFNAKVKVGRPGAYQVDLRIYRKGIKTPFTSKFDIKVPRFNVWVNDITICGGQVTVRYVLVPYFDTVFPQGSVARLTLGGKDLGLVPVQKDENGQPYFKTVLSAESYQETMYTQAAKVEIFSDASLGQLVGSNDFWFYFWEPREECSQVAPQLSARPLGSNILVNGIVEPARLNISAPLDADIIWDSIRFQAAMTDGLELSNFKLIDVLENTEVAGYVGYISGHFLFRADNQQVIPAGSGKTYAVRLQVANATMNSVLAFSFPATSSAPATATTPDELGAARASFIWSDGYGWHNDYGLGLPLSWPALVK